MIPQFNGSSFICERERVVDAIKLLQESNEDYEMVEVPSDLNNGLIDHFLVIKMLDKFIVTPKWCVLDGSAL